MNDEISYDDLVDDTFSLHDYEFHIKFINTDFFKIDNGKQTAVFTVTKCHSEIDAWNQLIYHYWSVNKPFQVEYLQVLN